MVTASLNDFHLYLGLHPLFEKVEKALKTYAFDKPGERVYIAGEKLFAIPALDNARTKENAPLEAHNRYIDIQVCLEGNETMGWNNRADCKSPKGLFDTEKDIIFFNDKPLSYFNVPAGHFAIFFPNDCHAPLIGEGMIRKVVFKIEVLG